MKSVTTGNKTGIAVVGLQGRASSTVVHASEVMYIHIFSVSPLYRQYIHIDIYIDIYSIACKSVPSHFSKLSLNRLVSRSPVGISDFCKE